jgi:hypothetical protein
MFALAVEGVIGVRGDFGIERLNLLGQTLADRL